MNDVTNIWSIKAINQYSELDYLLYKICFHGAPTIRRLKPASLICFRNNTSVLLKDIWYQHKQTVRDIIPFKYRELKCCDKGVNVLFYREDWLTRLINMCDNKSFLHSKGYMDYNSLDEVLDILVERHNKRYPDEIGLFLGYPLSDVIAFTSKDKDKSIGVGCWRVYSNLRRANKLFELYYQARKEITTILQGGIRPYEFLSAI